ncbi:MAG: Lrp/AsnC family transcriptional regulator [Candidatus Marsarchaeota archaeon]|jgi:DNA-binding Lrp family transcriptional regulator|nr:Lrp/AsnC family transcriptional regulator [Candidatus Marsarchaeota archaeon]
MENLPLEIKEAFEKLKNKSLKKERLAIRKINGRYYLYRDRHINKKLICEYIGRFNIDGQLIEKKKISTLDQAKDYILSRGGIVFLPQEMSDEELEAIKQKNTLKPIYPSIMINEEDKEILKALSMNGLINYAAIAKLQNVAKYNLSNYIIEQRVKKLEQQFNIKYIPEINMLKLGFNEFILLIKFFKKPDPKIIKEAFENDPRVVFAAMIKGEYDVIIFFYAKNNYEMATFIHQKRSESLLREYNGLWYSVSFFEGYNFVPLRQESFELLKERMWIKPSRKIFHPGELILEDNEKKVEVKRYNKLTDITTTEYNVLKALSQNKRISFKEIAIKNNINISSVDFAIYNLKKKKFLKRITITLQTPPIHYNLIIFINIINMKKNLKTRKELLLEIISKNNFIDKYALVGDIEDPHGILFIASILNENDAVTIEENIRNSIKGIEIKTSIITTILLGNLCYRNFDETYSNQYIHLSQEYKVIKENEKIQY